MAADICEQFGKEVSQVKNTGSAVPQEHTLGCAIACVAARLEISYARALMLFAQPENAWTRGYFCQEVVDALAKGNAKYIFRCFNSSKHSQLLEQEGTIVFVSGCDKYPSGHYLIRACRGWMNSWMNHPEMIPVRAGFQRTLPGRVSHVIYEVR